MELSLSSDLQQFVDQQIAIGAYGTPSEVVGDALRLLRLHELQRNALIEDLREKVAVGIEQLDRGESYTADEVFGELRRRNASFQPPVQP